MKQAPIPGFPGYYISEDGTVWSVRPKNGRGGFVSPRRLGVRRDQDGYKCVSLQCGPKNLRRPIHQLLLMAFVGPCPAGMVARHLNDIKDDLRLDNLCWGTQLENGQDKARNGKAVKGSRHHKAKLTEEQVIEIRKRLAAGEFTTTLAVEFGVRSTLISMIRLRQIWRHI